VPFFLILLLVASMLLAPGSIFYAAVLFAQIVFYATAALSCALEYFGVHVRVLSLPQYFVLANLASLVAFYKFLSGERYARWEPIRDTGARVPVATNHATAATTPDGRNA
jgi:hypothetical protein